MSIKTVHSAADYRVIEQQLPLPLGHQSWWLNTTAGAGNWDAIIAYRGSEVAGVLPFTRANRKSVRLLGQPPLSVGLGPFTFSDAPSGYGRLSQEFEVIDALFDDLPPHDLYRQRWHVDQQLWQPLYWRDYQQTTGYTYVIGEATDARAWDSLRGAVRTDIRRAQNRHGVHVQPGSAANLFPLVTDTFAAKGMKPPFTQETLSRLHRAAVDHSAGEILIALDADDRPCAGGFFVWDRLTTWYLVGGDHATRRTTGAMSLVLWDAITRALGNGRRFDFEGSMIPSVERYFRAFGGDPVPYLTVSAARTHRGQLGMWRLGGAFPRNRSR